MRGTIDSFDGAVYFGVSKDAMPQWRALLSAQEKAVHYPCLQNPYYYMDYDGYGFEDEQGRANATPITAEVADSLCYECPLIKQCYDFALANNEKHGVWGGINFGLDEDQLF